MYKDYGWKNKGAYNRDTFVRGACIGYTSVGGLLIRGAYTRSTYDRVACIWGTCNVGTYIEGAGFGGTGIGVAYIKSAYAGGICGRTACIKNTYVNSTVKCSGIQSQSIQISELTSL